MEAAKSVDKIYKKLFSKHQTWGSEGQWSLILGNKWNGSYSALAYWLGWVLSLCYRGGSWHSPTFSLNCGGGSHWFRKTAIFHRAEYQRRESCSQRELQRSTDGLPWVFNGILINSCVWGHWDQGKEQYPLPYRVRNNAWQSVWKTSQCTCHLENTWFLCQYWTKIIPKLSAACALPKISLKKDLKGSSYL